MKRLSCAGRHRFCSCFATFLGEGISVWANDDLKAVGESCRGNAGRPELNDEAVIAGAIVAVCEGDLGFVHKLLLKIR